MAVKYVRVIMAVQEENLPKFEEVLDQFIEEGIGGCDLVEGAYVSDAYETRDEALGKDFRSDHKFLCNIKRSP